jgi:hypothetical protein
MANKSGCRCPRCTIRGLMGPAVLITIGVLFLLHEVRGSMFDFSNTWPFILIVIGAIMLASSLAPMDGHIDSMAAPPVGPQAGPPTMPGSAQNSLPGQGR